jgi:hypothetical protein
LITGPHHRLRARVAPDACVLPVGRSSSLHRRPLPGLAGCDRAKYICSSCSVHLLPGNGQCFILLPFVCRISAGSRNSSSFKYEDGRAHDRLLGRLLSLDFDPTTCLSRYEKSKRWKPSPFPVSSYLVEKLRQYEATTSGAGQTPRITVRPWRSSCPAEMPTTPSASMWCGSPSKASATGCSAWSPPSSTRCY